MTNITLVLLSALFSGVISMVILVDKRNTEEQLKFENCKPVEERWYATKWECHDRPAKWIP